jgi:transcription termination/antitermination protein NusA
MHQVETILAKKAEGRPVTPEEYHVLSQFVDRVERGLMLQRLEEEKAKQEREQEARSLVPETTFEIPLDELEISERVRGLLQESGYQNAGDLMYQMAIDPDAILALSGVGPKAMQEIEQALQAVAVAEEPVAAEPEVQVEPGSEVEEAELVEPAAEVELEAAVDMLDVEVPVEAVEELAPEDEAVDIPEAVETEVVSAEEGEAEAEVVTPEAEAEEELPTSLDELFALKPEVLDMVETGDEEDEEEEGRKKKKKKKKYVEMEYDPEKGVTVVKKKRKRGGGDWSDDWDI